jgi:hypothetical protein
LCKKTQKGLKSKKVGMEYIFRIDDVDVVSVDGSNIIFKSFQYKNIYLVDFDPREAHLSTLQDKFRLALA